MNEFAIYPYFFGGFSAASVLPIVVGVFLGIKRALWASAFDA